MVTTLTTPPVNVESGPVWEVARLFPEQGKWSEEDYFLLSARTNRLIELIDGHVEFLEMPTRRHQRIVQMLWKAIEAHAETRGLGEAYVAGYPLRVRVAHMREPDVVFILSEHLNHLREECAEKADLVVEVVSQDRNRDLVDKRRDYARAGVAEYWIVDPAENVVTVLTLSGEAYVEHGTFRPGSIATSKLLAAFEISVTELLQPTKI